ncbi:unnamed protein product, partial [Symbiodinium sp. CCMP2456]
LMEVGQLTMFACYCDSTVHVPGQAALALAEIVGFAASSGLQSVSVEVVAHPLLKALILIFCSVVLESTMREGVAAQFRGADAESMVTSFRTMLKGLSDAELLLDESLQITDDDLLRGSLVMEESLKGQVFSNLLLPDTEEQARFQKFIHRQSPPASQARTPACLRISLRTSQAQRVGADLFHVRIPHLRGCTDAFHLLGLKLDADSNFTDLETDSGSSGFRSPNSCLQSSSDLAATVLSSDFSEASSGAYLEALWTFSEVCMKVDARANPPKVVSVHFNYRHRGRQNPRDLHNQHLPDLRMFIRPTQWARVYRTVRAYASAYTPCRSNGEVGEVWIRLGHPSQYRLARRARMRGADSGHVWIELKDVCVPARLGSGEMMYIGEEPAQPAETTARGRSPNELPLQQLAVYTRVPEGHWVQRAEENWRTAGTPSNDRNERTDGLVRKLKEATENPEERQAEAQNWRNSEGEWAERWRTTEAGLHRRLQNSDDDESYL